MTEPLVVDLYCRLGGWTEGFLAEGYRARGYDIEVHQYGEDRYPGDLVVRDVLQMHGSEVADADVIVGSSPCQEYSYMAMPWSLAKAKAAAIRADETGEMLRKLNELFLAQFRIQREASEAAGRYIPMVVENVRGAQPWVGRARGNYGSIPMSHFAASYAAGFWDMAQLLTVVAGAPPLRRRLPRDLCPALWRHSRRPRSATLSPQRLSGRVLAIIWRAVIGLARKHLHNVDSVAHHVGGAFLPFRSRRHRYVFQ